MTAHQQQLRRDTATNLNAATPAAGEPGWDTTNKRLVIGDGSTLGGIRHASAKDVQNNNFTYGTVGGTANAITLTHSASPVTSYTAGQAFKFKATSTNTGATTVNIDGLGTKNIYKLSNGSLTALTGGEIVSGVVYAIYYDGTQFQLSAGTGSGVVVVQQVFTSSGTYTPTAGMQYCIIEAVGGGGDGGNSAALGTGVGAAGGGGGAGGYSRRRCTAATIGSSQTVTVGAAGGTTTVGTLVSAGGGSSGSNASATGGTAGGAGGTASSGDVNITGGDGSPGFGGSNAAIGGTGGASFFGGGARGATNGAGSAAAAYGSGGGGAARVNSTSSGGAGAGGIVIITEYCSG